MRKKIEKDQRIWAMEISKLNESVSGQKKFLMGSPGSAQVTRVRLLSEYNGLFASTHGSEITLSLAPL